MQQEQTRRRARLSSNSSRRTPCQLRRSSLTKHLPSCHRPPSPWKRQSQISTRSAPSPGQKEHFPLLTLEGPSGFKDSLSAGQDCDMIVLNLWHCNGMADSQKSCSW